MKNLFITLVIIIAFSSWASTNLVHLSILQPASVTLPPYIKNVAVVNKTEVSKKSKVFNVIDKAVSLESPNFGKEGSQATIIRLSDELKKNNRFDDVILLTNSGFPGRNLTSKRPARKIGQVFSCTTN